MKMKRYFAPDSRQALRALREEQGPDAVILSNRRVKGGVEIIAAMDYEDALDNAALGNPNALADIDPYQNTARQQAAHCEAQRQAEPLRTSSRQGKRPQQRRPAASESTRAHRPAANNHIKHDSLNTGTAKNGRPHKQSATHAGVHDLHSATSDKPDDASTLSQIQNELAGLRNIMEAPLMQFSWGETGRVQPLYASLLKQLMTLGLSAQLSQGVARKLAKQGLSKNSWLESLNYVADMVPVNEEDIIASGGIVSLIGPTGVGKTTTIAKLAARFALKHGRRCVTLITTDNYRIGAHEQLRSYGRILGIPVHVASDSSELKSLLDEADVQPGENHLTLIDTAGVSQKDIRLTEQVNSLAIDGFDMKNYLVLSATGQMNLQDEVVRAFSPVRLDGCVVTKIDEAASLGEIISVLIQHNLPATFVCDGQKVPDDLHRARGKLLVKEAIKLMRNLDGTISNEELAYKFGGVTNNANN